MSKVELEKLLEEKRQGAEREFENLNREDIDNYREKLEKANRVDYPEKEFKQLVEEIKAIEFILSDEDELENVENGADWSSYVSRFTING